MLISQFSSIFQASNVAEKETQKAQKTNSTEEIKGGDGAGVGPYFIVLFKQIYHLSLAVYNSKTKHLQV